MPNEHLSPEQLATLAKGQFAKLFPNWPADDSLGSKISELASVQSLAPFVTRLIYIMGIIFWALQE